MSRADDLYEPLMDAVICGMEMGQAQKRYFSAGLLTKHEDLIASKDLERKFDRMTLDLADQVEQHRARKPQA